ncbi:MAG: lysophospholipid acyltransferase family protein [Candidatus Sumerlaeia bacterium]|nr:lysophospholipid acyltransferase family protein [Candidatus Sumerlaeia bacterium]
MTGPSGRRERRIGGARAFRHRATARLLLALMSLVPRLSLETAQAIGCFAGDAARTLLPSRRRRALEHLRLAMPERSGEHPRILRETFRHMGMVAMEALWAPGMDPVRDLTRISVANPEAVERIRAAAEDGKRGIVFLIGHIGAWELLGPWIPAIFGRELMVVASPPHSPALEEPMRRLREAGNKKVVWRGDAALSLVRHLKRGGVVVLLADHNVRGESAAVPFFGRPSQTLLAPASLALRTGALVVTGAPYRRGRGRVEVLFDDPLPLPELPASPAARREAEIELTAAYTARIEALVRRDPGQWLWTHRRWRQR